MPQLLSDKVVMTPPFGGNKKGAVWGENKNTLKDWKVDFGFRVAVTDAGSGALQVWYAANGKETVSTHDIYSVGRFDGLAVVIDTVGGKQKIRGFLNDGSADYKNHGNVESLAFGHCDYQYRNRGDPSHLTIKSSSAGLEVTIDDQPCFSTNTVTLPSDYFFGMTGSSNDPPDSFEVYGFHLSPYTPPITDNQHQHDPPAPRRASSAFEVNQDNTGNARAMPNSPSSQSLASLEKRLDTLQAQMEKTTTLLGTQFEQLFSKLNQPAPITNDKNPTVGQLASLDTRLSDLAKTLQKLETELKSGDHSKQFQKLSKQVADVHSGVTEHVPGKMREYMIAHTPRIGFILYSFMAFQTACGFVWVWYRWRKSTMPKKYL